MHRAGNSLNLKPCVPYEIKSFPILWEKHKCQMKLNESKIICGQMDLTWPNAPVIKFPSFRNTYMYVPRQSDPYSQILTRQWPEGSPWRLWRDATLGATCNTKKREEQQVDRWGLQSNGLTRQPQWYNNDVHAGRDRDGISSLCEINCPVIFVGFGFES